MKLYPAIDLRGGQAVRLYQGDYEKMTVYNADPVAQAQEFIDAGAKYLHVVDLDGAKDDTTANLQTIAAIAKAYRLYKEYGPEQYVQILQLIADTWNGAAWSVTGYLLGGVAVFLREYGEEYSRPRFIKRLRGATYEMLRDEARRQQRGSSDVAHALAVTKLYNLTGGRGTVDPRRLTVLD